MMNQPAVSRDGGVTDGVDKVECFVVLVRDELTITGPVEVELI